MATRMKKEDKYTTKNILYIASLMGKMILQNGGETYRTEETIVRTCEHYNIKASSYATLNTIITSIDIVDDDDKNVNYTIVDRINYRTINLKKVFLINDLARNLHKYPVYEIKKLINRINRNAELPFFKKIFAHVLIGMSFAPIFGGGIGDSCTASVALVVIALISKLKILKEANSFFMNMVGSFAATLVAIASLRLGFIGDVSTSIITAIMLLAPGLAFTNSVRDIIAGDFVSGISRGVEALAVGVALAAGTGLALSMFIR